jgi:hypothetical protein
MDFVVRTGFEPVKSPTLVRGGVLLLPSTSLLVTDSPPDYFLSFPCIVILIPKNVKNTITKINPIINSITF